MYEDKVYDESRKNYFHINAPIVMTFIIFWIWLAWRASTNLNEFLISFATYFVILGVVCFWTATEYFYHRFSRHGENRMDPEGPADPDYMESIFRGHLGHHVFMNQKYRIVQSQKDYIKHIVPVYFLLYFVLSTVALNLIIAGWIFGSLLYDGFHLAYHFNWPIPGAWF